MGIGNHQIWKYDDDFTEATKTPSLGDRVPLCVRFDLRVIWQAVTLRRVVVQYVAVCYLTR